MHRILNGKDGVSICELKGSKHIICDEFCIQYVKDDNKSFPDRTYVPLGNSECQAYHLTRLEYNHNFQYYPKGLNPDLNEVLKDAIDASNSIIKANMNLPRNL